jgi:putative flippase GtrA
MMEPLTRLRELDLRQLHKTPEGLKLIKYAAVSAVSVLVSFVVLTMVYGVLHLWSEVPSTLFANIVASVPNYFLNRRWVWGKSGRSHVWREIVPFWTMSITGILLSIGTATLARDFVHSHHLDHLLATVIVVGANLAAFGVLWIVKFLILGRLFAQAPAAPVEAGADV